MKLLLTFILFNINPIVLAYSDSALEVNQSIVADYLFNSDLTSSIFGAPDLEYLGNNINYQEDTIFGITKTVVDFDEGEGFKLDVSNLITSEEYSIAMVFKISIISGYTKLIDFKNLVDDQGLYSLNGKLRFYPNTIGNEVTIPENQFVQLFFTRNISGLYKGYIDQELQFEYDDIDGDSIPELLLHFFRDDMATANLENSPGSVTRITIFNKALTQAEIQEFHPLDTIFCNGFE